MTELEEGLKNYYIGNSHQQICISSDEYKEIDVKMKHLTAIHKLLILSKTYTKNIEKLEDFHEVYMTHKYEAHGIDSYSDMNMYVGNVVNSFYSIIEYIKRLGNLFYSNDEHFKPLLNTYYDRHFAYALVYRLRIYQTHIGLSIAKIVQKYDLSSQMPISFSLMVNTKTLAKESTGSFKKMLQGFAEEFDVYPYLLESKYILQALICDVLTDITIRIQEIFKAFIELKKKIAGNDVAIFTNDTMLFWVKDTLGKVLNAISSTIDMKELHNLNFLTQANEITHLQRQLLEIVSEKKR